MVPSDTKFRQLKESRRILDSIFDGVSKVEFDVDHPNEFIAMFSSNGERVPFSTTFSVENFITNRSHIQNSMFPQIYKDFVLKLDRSLYHDNDFWRKLLGGSREIHSYIGVVVQNFVANSETENEHPQNSTTCSIYEIYQEFGAEYWRWRSKDPNSKIFKPIWRWENLILIF